MTLLLLLACAPKDLPPPPDQQAGDSQTAVDSGGGTDGGGGGTDGGAGGGTGLDTETAVETGGTGDTGGGLPLVFSGDRPTNLLILALDTTRHEWFSRYKGYAETPTLDALMSEGFVLENHRSCSDWTWPSTFCFQAGMSDVDAGWVADGAAVGILPSRDVSTGEELLAAAGWSTWLVSANSFYSDAYNTATGFQHTTEIFSEDAAAVGAAAGAYLPELDGGAPWYLHLHYFDPHTPYNPPSSYLFAKLHGVEDTPYDLNNDPAYEQINLDWDSMGAAERDLLLTHLRARYAGEISYMSDSIGALLDDMRARGLLDDTLVVLWTDHGEQLLEHGKLGHSDMYEMENRATVTFWAEGLEPGTWSGPTTHADIWPTILEILGQPPHEAHTGSPVGARPADDHQLAVRYLDQETIHIAERSGVKLIYRWSGVKELYRLEEDPGEQDNVYAADDPDVIDLWEVLQPHVEAVHAIRGEKSPIDPGP